MLVQVSGLIFNKKKAGRQIIVVMTNPNARILLPYPAVSKIKAAYLVFAQPGVKDFSVVRHVKAIIYLAPFPYSLVLTFPNNLVFSSQIMCHSTGIISIWPR